MTLSVPFNDTSRIFKLFEEELKETLYKVAKSGWWLQGEHNQSFSKSFAEFCNARYCVPVANGTDALELALRASLPEMQPHSEHEVITVANAGGYTSTACHLVGAKPVYVDIDPLTQLICLDSLKNALNEHVRAVVITHLYGGAVDMYTVRKCLDDSPFENIVLIEDCAQAHGAKVGNERVGSLGDLATFSFYPTKNLGALGDAGAITTSDPERHQKVRSLHQYGWTSKYQISHAQGRNSRMDEMQAAVLDTLLPHLDTFNKRRIEIRDLYLEAASEKLQFLDYSTNDFVGHLTVAKTPDRDGFSKFMSDRNIATDIHYPTLDCDQLAWQNKSMRIEEKTNLKNSRQGIQEIISIPCFPQMREEEVQHVVNALSDWEKV